jgi:ribonuclease Z
MTQKATLTFLGTASSVPTARRNHTAQLLQYKNEAILFDCGEGTQRQFRKAKLNPCRVTKILLSHWHADHSLGIPGLLQSMIMNGYNKELELYGPKGTKEKIRTLLDFYGINPNSLKLKVFEVTDKIFCDSEEFYFETKSMDHNAPTNGYSFIIKEKSRLNKTKLEKLNIKNSPIMAKLAKGETVKINGKKVDGKKLLYKEPQRKFTFIVDTRYCKNAVVLAKDADILTCESSFSSGESELAEDHGHMTSAHTATLAKESKAKKLVLIHLSQRYDMIPKKILEEAKKVLKGTKIQVSVAEDLDNIDF